MSSETVIPEHLYDCNKLFPPHVGAYDPQNVDPETLRWLSKSRFTCGVVGFMSKVWLKGFNSVKVYNREVLIEALDRRPTDVPLITVSNHHSCMDEPLMWGILDVRQLFNQRLMRWSLAAHDICFTQSLHSIFFSFGKSIPIGRGLGIFQKGMDFAVDRVNEGSWIHLFPEGKVNEEKSEMRLKWGVGRLIMEAKVTPIVIPIYHQGMDSILPNRTPYWPRMFKRVTVLIGNPIHLEDTLQELRQSGADAERQREVITGIIQTRLYGLKVVSEILHAKHLADGWYHSKVDFKPT